METVALKVNVNCHGCRRRVKKILKKIEGVYAVNVDAENQRVIVRGTADSTTLINKLARSGKHAELWFPKSQQSELNQEHSSIGKTRNKNLHHQQNNSSRVVSKDRFKYPNLLQDEESFGDGWGIQGHDDNGIAMAAQDRAKPYMGSSGHMAMGDGNYENDIGAMISRMEIHGHPDHHHSHQNGYDMSGSFGSGRNRLQRMHNYHTGSRGYGNVYQLQGLQQSPSTVENLWSPQFNQNPSSGWLGANVQGMQAMLNDNNRMHDGYGQPYYHY